MSNYVYENPLDNGYAQFRLTKKQHNKLFKHRQIKWYDKYEYYYSDEMILMHRFYNRRAIAINTILFPIVILINGLAQFNETLKDYKKMYNQKKYGSFTGDSVCSNTDMFNEIVKMINME